MNDETEWGGLSFPLCPIDKRRPYLIFYDGWREEDKDAWKEEKTNTLGQRKIKREILGKRGKKQIRWRESKTNNKNVDKRGGLRMD